MRDSPTSIPSSFLKPRHFEKPMNCVNGRGCLHSRLFRLLAFAVVSLPAARAQQQSEMSPGIAWRVIGSWHLQGQDRLLTTGDLVEPGSLLLPGEGTPDHSITVLLPDGQRVLYECFAPKDCARGFRVPSLYREPTPVAVDLLERVNAVLTRSRGERSIASPDEESRVPRDETVSVLNPENKIEIAGLAAKMSSGSYSYEVHSLSGTSRPVTRDSFEKSSQPIMLKLPSEGLFDVLMVDSRNTPRVDLVVAAFPQPRADTFIKSFRDVKTLLVDWNEDFQGWPIHEFERDYLRSRVLGIPPLKRQSVRLPKTLTSNHVTDAAPEPRFSPIAGVFTSDTAVTLQCDMPDATIHFTVDGSQPLRESPVYRAPIMVKGTALTIKAFATLPGKNDSPVVTGIFRIGD